ncbi:MAG: hypothetical protein ACI3XG_09170 [Faecousia sp.]
MYLFHTCSINVDFSATVAGQKSGTQVTNKSGRINQPPQGNVSNSASKLYHFSIAIASAFVKKADSNKKYQLCPLGFVDIAAIIKV